MVFQALFIAISIFVYIFVRRSGFIRHIKFSFILLNREYIGAIKSCSTLKNKKFVTT